jgi:hypothetical protein
MSMYNGYDFPVEEMLPSIMPSYSSGRVTASRTFSVPCIHAEEFCLRMIGKYYDPDAVSAIPQIAAPYPFDNLGVLGWGQVNLVASSFAIEPLSECVFRNDYVVDGDEETKHTLIVDPTAILQQAHHWIPEVSLPFEDDNTGYLCKVTISYSENPCDCVFFNNSTKEWEAHSDVLPGTCLYVERNPSYEMFTLPNGGLVWEDLPSSTEQEQAARRLKADSYAYKIIPKADIIVHWNNVPVRHLCAIENHLKRFRGTVNDLAWGEVLFCDADAVNPTACGCGQYEPETIMFIDFQEDRAQKTDAFGGFARPEELFRSRNMNTTTLKLVFKQKRIEKPTSASYSDSDECPDDNDEAYGWNHLFLDREGVADAGEWMRVIVEATGNPLFELKSFSDIFYPVL